MNATLAIAATTSLLGHGTLLDERRVFGSLIHRKLASEGADGEIHAYARGLRQKQRRQRLLGEGDCPGGAFLWKIVHDETNEHVGFGLGTVHIPTSEATSEATLASIMNAVDDSCDVYGELNVYSEDILDDIIECMLSNDVGMDIGLLPGEIVEEYKELAKPVVDEFRGTLDGHVMASGRPAGGVEDVSTQCDLLLDIIMDEVNVQRRRLQTELFANDDTDPLADLFAQELVHLYTCGNGDDVVALFDMLGDEMLLDNRNYQMAEAIASILGSSEDKKVMFAFGLAHWIFGDTSLDVLLKDRGYSLVHVPHWDEDDAVNFSNELCGVEFNDDTELFQLMGDSVSSGGQVATPNVSGGETTSEVPATEGPVNQESSELSNPVTDGTADEPASVTSAATPAGFQRYVNPSCHDDPTYLYDSKYSCSDIGDGDLIEVCGEVLFETFLDASEPRPDEFPTQNRLVVTVGSRYCPVSCSALPQCYKAREHYTIMNVVCEDDPSFLYKGKPGYNCAYIARELPEKCSKTHNGNLVGFVDCPVSCGMVDKCQVRVDEGEDNDNMLLDGMDDDWVWVEGSRFYDDDFAFDPFAGVHLNEEGFMQVMEDDAFEDLAFDPFTGTLEKEKKIEEEAKLYVDGSMWEHDVEILNDDLDTDENDEMYLRIKKLEDKTIYHVCSVSEAVNGTDVVPVIYCTFYTPIGLPAKAEILDGQCAPFMNEANSTYFTDGVAAAVHAPTLTDVEKRQGTFDHTYCAGLDFVYEEKSVVQKRYLMQISYHYLVDKKSGEVQGLLGADVHDENRGVEKRNMAVAVGFGAFGGVILTLALVAMILGKKRRQREVTEGRNMYNSSGKYPELVNAPSIEAVNEAFRVGGSLDGGDVGGEDVTDGDYETAVGETERQEWKNNELV